MNQKLPPFKMLAIFDVSFCAGGSLRDVTSGGVDSIVCAELTGGSSAAAEGGTAVG